MNKLILVTCIALFAGCAAVEPISERANYLTYAHGSRDSGFKQVFAHAAQKCEEKQTVALHMSTVCPDRCVTNFECVKR
jgi:hypothetical protein